MLEIIKLQLTELTAEVLRLSSIDEELARDLNGLLEIARLYVAEQEAAEYARS